MSTDLLRRLGERALGTSAPLRPAVSPLFVSAASPSALVAGSDDVVTPDDGDEPASRLPGVAKRPFRSIGVAGELRRDVDAAASRQHRVDEPTLQADRRIDEPRPGIRAISRPHADMAHPAAGRDESPDATALGDTASVSAPSRDTDGRLSRSSAPASGPRDERPMTVTPSLTPSQMPGPDDPAAWQHHPAPAAREEHAQVSGRLSGLRAAVASVCSTAPAQPAIRVTIGRIEVRAAKPAHEPVRVPERRPTRLGLSLDEYLSSRKGERDRGRA